MQVTLRHQMLNIEDGVNWGTSEELPATVVLQVPRASCLEGRDLLDEETEQALEAGAARRTQ